MMGGLGGRVLTWYCNLELLFSSAAHLQQQHQHQRQQRRQHHPALPEKEENKHEMPH